MIEKLRSIGMNRWARLLGIGATLVTSALLTAPAALATFHLVMVEEVYPGSAAHPNSGFVELQMYEAGQNFVGGLPVTLRDATGATIGTFTFPADLPGTGVNQQTMLVGDDGVQEAFGVKPDLESAGFNVPADGGSACWGALDCVSWGGFSATTTPDSGVPATPSGIPDGKALVRRTTGGSCSNLLDEADDTNDSDADLLLATPTPQSYTTVPSPPTCTPPAATPVMTIDAKPPSPTNSTEALFQFHGSPVASAFECRLDRGAYLPCDSGSASYASLAEGLHTFKVRGENANGVGTPTANSWVIDRIPPSAEITSHPANPSPGKSASFRYKSTEGGSKFECRLQPLEVSFAPCNTQPKVYAELADGEYEFELKAIDQAGNVQEAPTVFAWKVDNSLEDKTPPDTAIASAPPDPSSSPVASFTYSSTEAGSTFQCKLDSGSFNSCPASGITYTGLLEGAHTFQVRAIDSSNNIDLSPAGYSFQVVLMAPTIAPPAPLAPVRAPAAHHKRRHCAPHKKHCRHHHRGAHR
jgi:hypothetical protein